MSNYIISFFILINMNQQAKDSNLYSWNHLNDGAHIGNLETKTQKEQIFERIVEFDDWYREVNGGLTYRYSSSFWNTKKFGVNTKNEDRILYINNSIVPIIPKCTYLTKKLIIKALKNSEVNDPGNLGIMLSGTNYAKGLKYITSSLNEDQWGMFHIGCFLDNLTGSDEDIDATPPRKISYEEAKFYHLSMIKLYNDSSAVYRIHHELTNMGGDWTIRGFLICELVKQEGEWLIDDVYYIEKEDLIKPEDWNGYTMFDYFKYKDAYENGTPVDAVPEDPYEYQKWWPYKQIK